MNICLHLDADEWVILDPTRSGNEVSDVESDMDSEMADSSATWSARASAGAASEVSTCN